MQIRILLLFVLSTILLASCANQSELIVARYADSNITLNEFEQAYEKSVGGKEAAIADSISNYKNFLDLYVNYKMKLRDAQVRDFDNDEELMKEYEEYKKNVGESYLLEKRIITPGLIKLYNLRKDEVRASHIMLSLANKNEDEVYKKSKEIINEINNGANFDSLANVYSEDNYTKSNGGDVFYLSAGTMLTNLEDAIYSLKVGETFQEPVKTKFGFHIIKLTEKLKYRPSITASHILASVKDSLNNLDTAKSFEKINEIKAKLELGEDFAELSKKYCDDKGSRI